MNSCRGESFSTDVTSQSVFNHGIVKLCFGGAAEFSLPSRSSSQEIKGNQVEATTVIVNHKIVKFCLAVSQGIKGN
jgi:hypothetical protein